MSVKQLQFKKYPVLDQGFICLVDAMGDDSSIVQAARVSYGKDEVDSSHEKDRTLIRYLMSHSHTTPFEMVEIKFMVQVPMDCWRQWIRHRTANVNEYSTRYTEAIDMCQTTEPTQWRLQATDNKQGSGEYITRTVADLFSEVGEFSEIFDRVQVPKCTRVGGLEKTTVGEVLSSIEKEHQRRSTIMYQQRLACGVAKEQARKDLPLSTYTRAYWKCDLHNIFNFLRLRMDSHAQYEIRMYANAMYEIVKQIVPVACEAFEDYVLNGCRFSAMEMDVLKHLVSKNRVTVVPPEKMSKREWQDFQKKVGI